MGYINETDEPARSPIGDGDHLPPHLEPAALSATILDGTGRRSLLEFGADPTGTQYVDTALQAAFDWLREQDGRTIHAPAGQYKLSRKPDGESGQGYSTVIFRGTLEGDGPSTHFYLDPATTAAQNPSRYYPIRIGTNTEPTEGPIVFRDFKFTGNHEVIGGSSVMGLACRHDVFANQNIHSDDVTATGVWFMDTAMPFGSTKHEGLEGASTERQVVRHRNWRAVNNVVDKTSNKAFEFGQTDGGWIVGNDIRDCWDGPQGIFYSSRIWIANNIIRYRNTGVNITQGVYDFWILDNHVSCRPEALAAGRCAALIFRTEPTTNATPVIRNGVVRGNTFSNTQAHTLLRAFQFDTRTNVTTATYENVSFESNVFEGDVLLRDPTAPAKTTIQDLTFRGNRFTRNLDTVAQSANMVRRIRFTDNEFKVAQTIKASDFQFRDDVFTGGLTLDALSARIRGTVDAPAATITNSGTGNVVTARALL